MASPLIFDNSFLRRTIRIGLLALAFFSVAVTGCFRWTSKLSQYDNPPVAQDVPNPVTVPMVAREMVMDEVADELDNYFRIAREERVRLVDEIMTEGWIETHPETGSTLFEPWRKDSTRGYERLHATLQSVRRFAKVRVIPTSNSYLIDVKVYKELEEMPQPIRSTAQGPFLRHDSSLGFDQTDMFDPPPNKGWIPMGRDISLEQRILRNIHSRLTKLCGQ